jgi:hypothetical protein
VNTLKEWIEARAEVVANLAGDDPNDEAVWAAALIQAETDAGEILTDHGVGFYRGAAE